MRKEKGLQYGYMAGHCKALVDRCHLQMPPYDCQLGYRARSPFVERGRFANYGVIFFPYIRFNSKELTLGGCM